MRVSSSIALVILVGACQVPAKQAASDGGVADASGDATGSTELPHTMIVESPPDFSNSAVSTFRFSSNVSNATFECRIDEEAALACSSPYLRSLPDGTHTFSVRAITPSGVRDDMPAERIWTIDTVAPTTMLTGSPPALDNSVRVQFEFQASEDNVVFECSLDNAGYVQCVSGDSFGPVGNGAHSFAVRARDRAGNVGAPAVYNWTVDTSSPDTQIVSGPSGATSSTTATFTFTSADAGAGATYECSFDASPFAACTSPKTLTGLSEAQHTFAVRVRNALGTVDPTPATRTWTVDLTPPHTTIVSAPSGTVPVASASFTFTSNEPSSTFACSLDNAAFSACTSPANLTGLAQGPHTFAVRATDAAGLDDPTPATRTWTVDTIPPTVTITAGPAAGSTTGPYVTFAFTVSDGTVTCSFDSAPFAPCTSPVSINLRAGPHQFAVSSVDTAGNVTTVTRSWTVVCTAPDTTGAAGLLHLDDNAQTLTNAVPGGAAATLGDTTAVEAADPTYLAAARFAGGLTFAAAQHVAWPAVLPPINDLTIELWARPDASAGARTIFSNSDGRVTITVAADSPSTVRFSITIVDGGAGSQSQTAVSASVAAGAWHHVLASLQQPTLRLWVDGVRTQAAGVQLATPPALDAIRLGGTPPAAYSGALDEVWLAQTAITTDDAALARYCPM